MRPARALIDLGALRSNYRLARELGGGKALAIIKADAYGHGAVRCAQALEGEADGFGVATIEEALELRQAGIRAPILLLEGIFEPSDMALVAEHDFWFAVGSPWPVDGVAEAGQWHASPWPGRGQLPCRACTPVGAAAGRAHRADDPPGARR